MFKVQNLEKSIGTKKILKDINFEVGHGEIAIFLGGSGVGKSTLLRVLNNLEGYDQGSFTLDDSQMNLMQANKNHIIGMVFQQFNLFENLNVQDNINLALIKLKGLTKQQADQISSNLLENYGLSNLAHSSVRKLSGGQKQRLAIARTIALNPKIICMDEPTSALDPHLKGQVAKYITNLAKDDRIILLATHDISLVQQLNAKLYLMKTGTIVESCSTEEYNAKSSNFPLLHTFLNGHENIT